MITLDYEHLTPRQNCPHCGYPIDRSAGQDRPPEPGDFTVCFHCGAVLSFGPGLLLVKADLNDLDPDTQAEISRIQQAIRAIKR